MSQSPQAAPSKQALAGTRINAFMMDPLALTVVGLDTKDGPEHPLYDRRVFEPLDEGMVINVMAVGVIQPIRVRKNGDRVEVVVGRHRVMWAREANIRLAKLGMALHMVPTMSPSKDTDAEFVGIMVTENEGRKEDSFIGRAEKALKMSKLGMPVKDIAIRFNKSEAAVNQWLAYWDLSPEVQAQVAAGTVAASSAVQLAALPRAEQAAVLADATASMPGPQPGAQEAGGASSKAATQTPRKAVKAAIKKAATKKAGKAGTELDTTGQAVGRKLLMAIVEEGPEAGLDPNFLKGIQFALGDLDAARVAGLLKTIRTINAAREEKGQGVLYAG